MKPIIIIPAYNPPETFTNLISIIHTLFNLPIIIIDDGSEIPILQTNKYFVYKIIRNNTNEGKGASILKGFNLANNSGFTHALTLDADSQHDPKVIELFLNENSNISIVSGRRKFDKNMPKHRRISNFITSKILTFLCNTNIYDSQCGYRRYLLKDILNEKYNETGFQFESEILLKVLKHKKNNISHVNIPTIYNDSNSSIKNIIDSIKFIRLIIKEFLYLNCI